LLLVINLSISVCSESLDICTIPFASKSFTLREANLESTFACSLGITNLKSESLSESLAQ